MFSFFGLLLLIAAAVDLAGHLFGFDLTGVAWSPMIFMVLGVMLLKLDELERSEERY
jgi:hypothetical protein